MPAAPPPASISLSVQFSPAYVAQGQQLLEDIIASVVSGSPGLTTFSISGLPPFTTATFSPPSVTPTALTLLTISTTPNTPLGTYKLIITGTPQNGNAVTATLILNVITPVPYQNKCTSYIPTPLTEEREQALRIPGTRALQMPAQKFALPSIDPAIPCSTISPIEKQLDLYVYGSGPLQGVTVRFVIENAPFIVKQTDANGHVFFEYALFISPRTGLPVNSFHLDVLPQDGVHACAWVNANISGPAKLELTLTTNPPPNIALPLTYITDTPNTLFVFNSGQSLCPFVVQRLLSLDGHIAGSFTGAASGSVSLTTANSNDVIVVMVGINGFVSPGNSVSSVSAPGLTFTRRTTFTNPDGNIILEIWWAPAASPFNGSITVNLASSSNFTVMAIGVANSPNYTSPWDASSPATGSGGAGTSPSISYTPTNSNDFIIGFGGTSGTSVDTLSAGPGFTLIDTLSDPLAFPQTLVTIDEYQVVSGTPSSVTVSFSSALGHEWALIGDALRG